MYTYFFLRPSAISAGKLVAVQKLTLPFRVLPSSSTVKKHLITYKPMGKPGNLHGLLLLLAQRFNLNFVYIG
jgi:hypothetical protein